MADPWQFIEGAVWGLIPAAVVILLARNRGWFVSTTATIGIAAVAGVAAAATMCWWLGRRAEWEVRDIPDGHRRGKSGYLASVAVNLLLAAAIVGAGTFVLMTIGELGRGPRVDFPSAAETVPLGTVDADWTVQSLDGQQLAFGDLRGKTVFVNFWATWCPPCLAEMPSIQDLYGSLDGEDIEFVLISNEPPSVVAEFMADKRYTFPVYVTDEPPPDLLASDGIPATFILNPDGAIVFVHIGMADWDTDECRRFLRGLR
jgi:thiol-disulfide isomerase/thioredoxin